MGISYNGFGDSASKLSGLAISPPGALTAKYNNAPSWITPSGSLGAANGGVAYTFNFQAIDEENDTITYSIISGSLPSGISLSGNQLTGTPVNNPGNYTFTVSISDGNFSVNRTFNLDITNQTPIWNTAAGVLGSIIPNTLSSFTLSASDPNGDTITFSVSSGTLPVGMTLSGNVISGTPSTPGTSNFNITASDGKGGSVERAFSIIVNSVSYSKIIFEVQGHAGPECVSINEIQLFDSAGQVSYTVSDVYDSATGGSPWYWNSGIWGYNNLYDGQTTYGADNCTALLYNTSPNNSAWARILLNVSNKAITKARVYVGGTDRIPYTIKFYGVSGTYNKSTQINTRGTVNLTLLGTINFTVSDTSLRYADVNV